MSAFEFCFPLYRGLMGSSLQDVFNDFDYGNDEVDDINVEDSFFYETFSQLKDEVEVETAAPSTIETKKRAASGRRSKVVDLAEFEEAFTVLKSIQAAHEPSSITAITAFLHHRRGLRTYEIKGAGYATDVILILLLLGIEGRCRVCCGLSTRKLFHPVD